MLIIFNLIVCWFYSMCFILQFGANWTYHHQKLHSPDSKLWYFELYKVISTQLISSYIGRVGTFLCTWANGMVLMVSWMTKTKLLGITVNAGLQNRGKLLMSSDHLMLLNCLPKEQRSFSLVLLQSRKCQGSIPNLILMWLTTLHPCLQRLGVI